MWVPVQVGTLLCREIAMVVAEGADAGDSQEDAEAKMVAVMVRRLPMMSAGTAARRGTGRVSARRRNTTSKGISRKQVKKAKLCWWQTPMWLLRLHWRML